MATNGAGIHRVGVSHLDQPGLRMRVGTRLAEEPSVRLDERHPDLLVVGEAAIGKAAGSAEHILAVLTEVDRHSATDALDAGAHGIVLANDVERSIVPAVHAVRSGLVVVPEAARQAVRRPTLSSREKQILSMVVIGLTNAEIAGKLHLAESTVKSHLSSIFHKLGVRSRRQAADVVLDPRSGLGTGIVAITPAIAAARPYTQPVVS
jgi:DNA-binding NarL/FixJ family response regulator